MKYFNFLIIATVVLFSCNKEEFETSDNVRLAFSVDTVMFDTVFTTIGSTTKRLKVYNNYKKTVKVSSIYLAGGNNSDFRLNIDGMVSNNVSDIEILANDSLYIFVEVTVNPNNTNNPVLLQDSIIFVTNSNIQDIDLVAVGQDVHLINGEIIGSETWNNDKPYLVYNSMLVDSLETLTINSGVHVHFHHNSNLIVKGTLIVNGTLDEQVIFEGDRLEEDYFDVPGQWGVIVLTDGSLNNRIEHAVIKNAIVGLQVGEYNANVGTNLFLSNTRIENMNFAGLYMFNSSVIAANCLIANCGFYGAFMAVSGVHKFYHCTFANYFELGNRQDPTVLISNNISVDGNEFVGNMDAYFGNSIIYGNKIEEIGTSQAEQGELNYLFEYCMIKDSSFDDELWPLNLDDTTNFKNIIVNKNPKFKNVREYDYELDTLSLAKDAGSLEIMNVFNFLETDILGQPRGTEPDLGAFERIEE